MKDKWEIILSGVGGQGLIVGGTILGEAATVYEDKNATQTSSYGVETRGTFTKSGVIISNRDIYYPEVLKEDILLALAPVAYDKCISSIDENAVLIYDSSMVSDVKTSKARQYGYPITSIARELGNVAAANIIAIGIIVKMTGVVKAESVLKVIKERFADKEKVIDINIKAFNRGIELVESLS